MDSIMLLILVVSIFTVAMAVGVGSVEKIVSKLLEGGENRT